VDFELEHLEQKSCCHMARRRRSGNVYHKSTAASPPVQQAETESDSIVQSSANHCLVQSPGRDDFRRPRSSQNRADSFRGIETDFAVGIMEAVSSAQVVPGRQRPIRRTLNAWLQAEAPPTNSF
jgi:hypothetical protein